MPGENLESAWSRLQVQPVETVGDEKKMCVCFADVLFYVYGFGPLLVLVDVG